MKWTGFFALLLTICLLTSVAGAATETNYRIGPDDVLSISVSDNKELDQVVFVRPDGHIALPLVGDVQAAGLTVAELSARLNELYGKNIIGAQVTVAVREIRSRPVFFIGGVLRPGPMQLTQDLTLLQALSVVGGLTPAADLESAFVLRGNERIPVNLLQLVQKADVTQNIKLLPGDTIVVPNADVVYVQGEVKTPRTVPLTRNLTILRAIAEAGGFTPLAAPKRVTLIRAEGSKKERIRVNVDEIMSDPGGAADVPLKANDIIIVPQRFF